MTGDSVIAFIGGAIFLGGGRLSRPPRDGWLVAAGLVLLITAALLAGLPDNLGPVVDGGDWLSVDAQREGSH